jgi:Gluconate 2-dehydrogenase subunit 3
MSTAQTLDRRRFLRSSTGVLTGLLAAGSPLALLAPSRAWALDLTALTSQEGATLLAAARTIAPHDKLEDAAYAMVVHSIDTAAAAEPAMRRQYQDGVAQLGANFASAGEDVRVAALRAVESSPFFQALRTNTLQVLYATPMAYEYFGYEGEAFSKGGYLYRGFNDLRWLPEVPEADSGPVFGAG